MSTRPIIILGKGDEIIPGTDFLEEVGCIPVPERKTLVLRLVHAMRRNLPLAVLREIKRQVGEEGVKISRREGEYRDIVFRSSAATLSDNAIQVMVEIFLRDLAVNFDDGEERQKFLDAIERMVL